jgi:hypothetical protein
MIEEIIKKYADAHSDKSYSRIADLILAGEDNVELSHRTLRQKVSSYLNSKEECCDNILSCKSDTCEKAIKNQIYEWPLKQITDTSWNKEDTVNYFKEYPLTPKESYKSVKNLIVISDLHGIYLDEKCFNVFLKVLAENQPDELVINGDALDLPFLSRHSQKLIKAGVLSDYSEIGEIELVRNKILTPLRKAAPNTNIVFRLGNHDERITNPYELTQAQLKRLAVVYTHYQTTKLDEMLGLKELNIEYDATPVKNYYGIYDVMHGLSLSKNAQEANILNRMGSGTTGHSHRLGVKYMTKGGKHYSWSESGHMRTQDEVEYLPTAVLPDWQQGFIEVQFNEDRTSYFQTPHAIINGECIFNGKLYK